MRKILLLLLMVCTLCVNFSKAQTAEIEGISYKVIGSDEAAVVGMTNEQTEEVTIREKIAIEGKQYFVTEIADEAFRNNSILKRVNLPSGVRRIGNMAFSSCARLAYINFPSTLKIIGQKGFEQCVMLSNVTFPENMQLIDDDAFYNCKMLTDIKLPQTMDSIGNRAFMRSGVKSITMPGSPTRVGIRVVAYTSLENVILPENYRNLGQEMFMGCANLKSINLENISVLPIRVFNRCTSLNLDAEQIKNITRFEYQAFNNSGSPTSIILRQDAVYCNTPENDNVVDLKSTDEGPFSGTALTKIDSGDIKEICPYFFKGCTMLSEITLQPALQKVYRSSFMDCEKNIVIDVLPSDEILKAEKIDDYNDYDFEKLKLGRRVDEDFWYSFSPRTIELYDNFTEIRENDFIRLSRNASSTTIILPEVTKKICAFGFNMAILGIMETVGVEEVEPYAFNNTWSDLIRFSGKLKTIASNAFQTSSVGELIFKKSNTPLLITNNNASDSPPSIGYLEINRDIETHGGSPFYYYRITHAKLGEGLTSTSPNEFNDTYELRLLTLPSTIKTIEEKSLGRPRAIECHATIPPEPKNSERPVCMLFVPLSSIDRYKSHPYWSLCTIKSLNEFKEYEWTGINEITDNSIFDIDIRGRDVSLNIEDAFCQITDLSGHVVYFGAADKTISLNNPGIYIISALGQSRKIIVH